MNRIAALLIAFAAILVSIEGYARYVLGPVERTKPSQISSALRANRNPYGLPFMAPAGKRVRHNFQTDPYSSFPDGETVTYEINSLGIRGREVEFAKPEGRIRLAILGDEIAFGIGVHEDATLAVLVERELRAARPGNDIEVLNLAMPAYKPVLEVRMLELFAGRFDPDAFVVVLSLDDAAGTELGAPAYVPTYNLDPVREYSVAIDRYLSARERDRAITRMLRMLEGAWDPRQPSWSAAKRSLRFARDLVRKRGQGLMIVMYPLLYELGPDYPAEAAAAHEVLRSFCEREGIAFLDLRPAFEGHEGPDLWVHPMTPFANAEGTELAARALSRAVLAENLLGLEGG